MPIPMFIGPWEAAIILLVVLVLFGGSRLAGLGKGVGRSIREFKDEVTTDDKRHAGNEVDAPRYDDRREAPRYDERFEDPRTDAPQTRQPDGTANPIRPDTPAAAPVDDEFRDYPRQ